MKVNIIGPGLHLPGGVANYLNVLLPRLRSETTVDARYLEIGGGQGGWPLAHTLRDQWSARRSFKSDQWDLVHINPSLGYRSFVRDGLIVRAAKAQRLRVLVFFHGWSRAFAHKVDGPLRGVFTSSFAQADGFVVLAREFEDKLRQWGVTAPIYRTTTMITDEFVDANRVQQRLKETESAGCLYPIKLLFMSRLEPAKGAMATVQAVHRLIDMGKSVSLTLAGDGRAETDIREYLHQHRQLEPNVKLVGHVHGDEKAKLLSSHHVFCLPTTYGEGLPTVVVEAIAHGLPVVTCPVGGLVDLFTTASPGRLVPGNDVEALTEALAQLVDRPERIASIGCNNVEYARTHLYSSRVAACVQQIYERTAFP